MGEGRVERIEIGGRRAWRKHYARSGRHLRMALLRGVSGVLGLDMLRPTPAQTPEQAARTEREMIGRLGGLGAQVPELIEGGRDSSVFSDVGPTLAARCKAEPCPDARAMLLEQGLAALVELHRRGGYASQATARNLAINGHGVAFIDLEEDPGAVMTVPAAQARDVLAYVASTARFLSCAPERYVALLQEQLAREPEAVRRKVAFAARRLRWLRWIAPLGGQRGRALGQALRALLRIALVLALMAFVEEFAELGLDAMDLYI